MRELDYPSLGEPEALAATSRYGGYVCDRTAYLSTQPIAPICSRFGG